jgi:hypothetical protein
MACLVHARSRSGRRVSASGVATMDVMGGFSAEVFSAKAQLAPCLNRKPPGPHLEIRAVQHRFEQDPVVGMQIPVLEPRAAVAPAPSAATDDESRSLGYRRTAAPSAARPGSAFPSLLL